MKEYEKVGGCLKKRGMVDECLGGCKGCIFDNLYVRKKPPLGIMPEKFWKEIRLSELDGAIKRYLDADFKIPTEWIEERNRLIRESEGK